MIKKNMYELISELDENILEKSLNIDCEMKLNKEKIEKREGIFMNRNIVKILTPLVVGVTCAAVIGVCFINGKTNTNGMHIGEKEMVQVVNPIMNVESREEMEKYLGLKVPNIESKDEEEYVLYIIDSYASLGRINYEDGATISIAEKQENINGVYGGTLEKTEQIKGISVNFYKMENIKYVEMEIDGVSVGYKSEATGTFETEVNELISSIQL